MLGELKQVGMLQIEERERRIDGRLKEVNALLFKLDDIAVSGAVPVEAVYESG